MQPEIHDHATSAAGVEGGGKYNLPLQNYFSSIDSRRPSQKAPNHHHYQTTLLTNTDGADKSHLEHVLSGVQTPVSQQVVGAKSVPGSAGGAGGFQPFGAGNAADANNPTPKNLLVTETIDDHGGMTSEGIITLSKTGGIEINDYNATNMYRQ